MTVTKNCIVTVDYRIIDTEGNLLHEDKEPIVYLHGNYGQIFKAIEDNLEGKKIGDTFKIALSTDEAFGNYDEELVVTEELSDLPEDLTVGMEIDGYIEESSDDVIIYTVTEIKGNYATLNGNHPLAGMDLIFEGKIMDIQEANEKEIREILEEEHHH